jgi:hypothetical protein
VCLSLGLGILAVAIGTLSTHPAAAAPGSTNVTVTNTPLPVQAPNSNTTPLPANVTNFPSTQNVSGTVNVGNFPAAQNVTITNPQTQPVPTSDAQNQPFAILVNPFLADGSIRGSASFTVPNGQRLIIEFIGGNACLPSVKKRYLTWTFRLEPRRLTTPCRRSQKEPSTALGAGHVTTLLSANRFGSTLIQVQPSPWPSYVAIQLAARFRGWQFQGIW